jgi:hypothetical protein
MLLDGVEDPPPLEVGAGIVIKTLVPQAGAATLVNEVVDFAGDVLSWMSGAGIVGAHD